MDGIELTIEHMLTLWAQETFSRLFPDHEGIGGSVEVVAAADERFGDYQCNAAMALAKTLKQPPRKLAEAFVASAPEHPAIAATDIAGPGFINIRLSDAWMAERLGRIAGDERLGTPVASAPETILLDYSSPNIAKPMHIGHIRSTVIGNALDRMFRFLGHKVIADNHLGDWGTQFGIILMGYRHFLDEDALARDPIAELERIYVESYNRGKEDEAWMDQARAELVKLQQGDEACRTLWSRFVELSMGEFRKIYDRLGVRFDLERGESYYQDDLAPTLDTLRGVGLLEESEGALVVNLEDEKLPVCIVRKTDGGFNYATTDIATVLSRVAEFQPDRIIYITDERQQLHFRQFFAICAKLGVTTRLEHVWFGLMRLPEGVFSTRQGNVIKLERLLDEAQSRAMEILRNSSTELTPAERDEIARMIGLGAVKYADLSQNPQSAVTFTWDKAMALDGNSAPYLQYACVRVASVQNKYRDQFPGVDLADYPIRIDEPLERILALRLIRFPDVVARAANQYRPNLLADYLFDLAQTYSRFYQAVPFLKAAEGPRESRVKLCGVVARTLSKGLELMGIETPGKM